MKVKLIGAPSLSVKSLPVKEISTEIKMLVSEMIDVMYEYNGIGLAAPQVGINQKIVVIDTKPEPNDLISAGSSGEVFLYPLMPFALINPEIKSVDSVMVESEEGCLSVPEIYGKVSRYKTINLKAKLIDGKSIDLICSGFLSIVIQHECDHLEGKLFTDNMSEFELEKIELKLRRLKKKAAARNFDR